MSLSPAETKATVLKFVDMINRRDFTTLPSYFTPHAKWVVLANSTKADWGGPFPANEMCQRAAAVLAPFDTWSYTARDVIVDVEGTLAVVDGVGKGRGPGPLRYDNNYMMKFTLDSESGKIKELKETLDCYEVEIMFESMQAHSKQSGWGGIEGVVTFSTDS